MDSLINIVFISDRAFCLCTGVAIHSLRQSRNKNRAYKVWVLAKEEFEEDKQTFISMSCENFAVEVIDISNLTLFDSLNYKNATAHVSNTAYYRFYLPEIFPKLDKLLYLDGDIIVRDSLEGLFDIDLEDKYAAVCKDIGGENYPAPYNDRLSANLLGYFNSGIMLLNLKKIREDNVIPKLEEYVLRENPAIMDQDALNVVFNCDVKWFNFSYNMVYGSWLRSSVEDMRDYYDLNSNSVEEIYTDAKILHFASELKPWLYYNIPGAEEWLTYFISSPMKYKQLCRTTHRRRSPVPNNGSSCESLRFIRRVDVGSSTPKVTVGVLVDNSIDLREIAEKLMTQTFENTELLFVVDDSFTGEMNYFNVLKEIDSRIFLFRVSANVCKEDRIEILKQNSKTDRLVVLKGDYNILPNSIENIFLSGEFDKTGLCFSQ